MIDFEIAEKIVEDYVSSAYISEFDNFIVLKNETIERPYGWIIYILQRNGM